MHADKLNSRSFYMEKLTFYTVILLFSFLSSWISCSEKQHFKDLFLLFLVSANSLATLSNYVNLCA